MMSGKNMEVAQQLLAVEPKCTYTHCYGHAPSLSCSDMVKRCESMKSFLEVTFEVTKLIKYSPKRQRILENIKQDTLNTSPGVRVLCPTRWTVKAATFSSIAENYNALQMTWETALEETTDTETKSRIIGVQAKMETFNFFFCLHLGILTFGHTDNLSRALQTTTMSASEGQEIARQTVSTLKKIRQDSNFDLFWEKVHILIKKNALDVSDAVLPRKKRQPKRFEVGDGEPSFHSDVKTYYRVIYYNCLDNLIEAIKIRFDQPGYKRIVSLENLFMSDDNRESIESVCQFYGTFNADAIEGEVLHLKIDGIVFDSTKCVIQHFQNMSKAKLQMYPECVRLLKLLLVLPASNAQSERCFSTLRRIKSWLRSSIGQKRLNHCMTTTVHKELLDSLDIDLIIEQFIQSVPQRKSFF